MYKSAIIAVGLLLASPSAFAEIEKTALPSDGGFDLYWWPKLAPLPGWHHDEASSLYYRVNALAPDGTDFAKATTVIYARALYKPRDPEHRSLDALIEDDKREFAERDPRVAIEEIAPLVTAGGQRLRCFTFFPRDKGNWELVAYGEEADFYLIFTLSSRSAAGYRRAKENLESLVRRYRESSQSARQRFAGRQAQATPRGVRASSRASRLSGWMTSRSGRLMTSPG